MCTELTSISARSLGHYRCINAWGEENKFKSSKLEESICKDVYLGVCFCKGNFAVKYLLGNAKRHVTIKLRYRGLSLSVVSLKKKKKKVYRWTKMVHYFTHRNKSNKYIFFKISYVTTSLFLNYTFF